MYSDRNMVIQLHIGNLRNNTTRVFNLVGVDLGFYNINDMENDYRLFIKVNSSDIEDKSLKIFYII